MENDLYDNFSEATTLLVSLEQNFSSKYGCKEKTFKALMHLSGITAAIGIAFTITTLLTIVCHHRLRKKHFIFPFNMILADCLLDVVILISYARSSTNLKSPQLDKIWEISFTVSPMVSSGSIFLVAVDQLLLFKFDPFGVKNILTKTRRIIVCIFTWVITISISVLFSTVDQSFAGKEKERFLLCFLSVVFTGFCYCLVYKTIATTPLDANHRRQERRKENKQVLRTYGLVLGTTFILFALPDTIFFIYQDVVGEALPACLSVGWAIMLTFNSMANSVIYWWRLREFRTIFSRCTVDRMTEIIALTNLSAFER